jgi:hypothetical protein
MGQRHRDIEVPPDLPRKDARSLSRRCAAVTAEGYCPCEKDRITHIYPSRKDNNCLYCPYDKDNI